MAALISCSLLSENESFQSRSLSSGYGEFSIFTYTFGVIFGKKLLIGHIVLSENGIFSAFNCSVEKLGLFYGLEEWTFVFVRDIMNK